MLEHFLALVLVNLLDHLVKGEVSQESERSSFGSFPRSEVSALA